MTPPAPIVAALVAPPGVLELGARIEVPVTRQIVSVYTAATLTAGTWTVMLEAPAPGAYQLVWRTPDAEPPTFETFVPIVVTAAGVGAGETVPVAAWTPTADLIGALCAAYTRQPVGGYGTQHGREAGTFTAETNPTLEQVQGYIAAAVDEVAGRVGLEALPARVADLARTTAAWHAAASVEAKRMPAQTDDAGGLYRAFISNFRASLDALIDQARWSPARLV